MKIAGSSLGIGVLYTALPLPAAGKAGEMMRWLGKTTGEQMTPFSFVQLSDAHVGFHGPPDPLGTKAFERAVELVNGLPTAPDLVLFTGDLTHGTEEKDVHAERMKQFLEISKRMKVGKVMQVPGEHEAGKTAVSWPGVLLQDTDYALGERRVHYLVLDNVSRALPEIGRERLAWLKRDPARFPKTAPIVVFTHRPLFDMKPEWEWFTRDGDDVLSVLAPYDNVTVLYGHIHRDHEHEKGHTHHYAACWLIFAFPDPEKVADKKPIAFDKAQPFRNLGIRVVNESAASALTVRDVELTLGSIPGSTECSRS